MTLCWGFWFSLKHATWQLLEELLTFYKYFQEEICQCLGLQKGKCEDDQTALFIHPSVCPQNLPSPSELVTAMSQGAKASLCSAFPLHPGTGGSAHSLGVHSIWDICSIPHPQGQRCLNEDSKAARLLAVSCLFPGTRGAEPSWAVPVISSTLMAAGPGQGWGWTAPSRALPVRSRKRSYA